MSGVVFRVLASLPLIAALTLLAPGAESSQNARPLDESFIEAAAISVDIPIPQIRPELTWLIKHPMKFKKNDLVKRFLKGTPEPEVVYSSIYGEGSAYVDKNGAQLIVFKYGFEFTLAADKIEKGIAKFIPKRGTGKSIMLQTWIDSGITPSEIPLIGEGSLLYSFEPEEGKKVASKHFKEIVGELSPPGPEFRVEKTYRLDASEDGLFHLNVTKYFRGIPLLDDFIEVTIDADKQLAGFAYFWDDRTRPGPGVGDVLICDAGLAVNQAKRWVIQQGQGTAPHLTLMNIKLGYIALRGDHITLIPTWLLFLTWHHTREIDTLGLFRIEDQRHKIRQRWVYDLESYDIYIAIEAITGRPTEL